MDNTRQQIVDSINQNTNILVTVSTDPSVDELSAALGLSVLLNNIDKRASAVYSGKTPAAINFLEPEKTFEDTADSLRDFIIALDKEKADHLRYKVDGDVVKIFITPYKTTLSQNDLEFSQGDYNVELVIAIGVKDQNHLDKALAAHGKILHDATVVTITAGNEQSSLGTIDWHDPMASSLSEMVASLADGIKTDKSLLDEQISTAFLTGIVSATDRFSNDRTSSRVMTMAAQLMAAGANQQLIAAKLAEAHDIGPGPVVGKDQPVNEQQVNTPEKQQQNSNELSIDRPSKKSKKPKKKSDSEAPVVAAAQEEQNSEEIPGEKELEAQIATVAAPPVAKSMEEIEQALKDATSEMNESASGEPAAAAPPEEAPTSEPELATAPVEQELPPLPPLTDFSQPAAEGQPVEVPFSPAPPQPGLVDAPAFDPLPTPAVEPAPDLVAAPAGPVLPPLPPLQDTPVGEHGNVDESNMIINDHGTFSNQPPSTTQPINSFNMPPAPADAPVDPFTTPLQPQSVNPAFEPAPAPVAPVETPQFEVPQPAAPQIGTSEMAAQLSSMPGSAPVDAYNQPAGFAQPAVPELPPLPPLPPLPSDASLPPLPPPPPVPSLGQPVQGLSGAVSGDVFGDGNVPAPAEQAAPTPPAEPGQFRIPGQG